MHIILAEDIGVALEAGFFFLGTVGTTLFAIGALISAACGKGPLTAALAVPTLLFALIALADVGYHYAANRGMDSNDIYEKYTEPLLVMAAIPAAVCLLAGFTLWLRKTRTRKIEA